MTRDIKQTREWYSVSYTSVAFVGFVVMAVVAVLAYRHMDFDSITNRARRAIDDATERYVRVDAEMDIPTAELKNAKKLLDEAVEEYDEGNFERALGVGERSIAILISLESQGKGSIRVLSAQGNVEYRHGERGTWKRLKTHESLAPGDWVKTSANATAYLLVADKTEFTLRPDTMVYLGGILGADGQDESTKISFGEMTLNTRDSDKTVTTPGSRARVRRDSKALVSFDLRRKAGRFASYSGEVEVTSKATGESRKLNALQQVNVIDNKLTAIRNLPDRPVLRDPDSDHTIELGVEDQIRLAWEPVSQVKRYVLQISGSRLFANKLIEDKRRSKTSALIRVRREGQFYWQVAALDAAGNSGPWSDTRSFRATAASYVPRAEDKIPPPLKILGKEQHGRVVIIFGKTELGASVTIDDAVVDVESDGNFRFTVELTQIGKNIVKVVATDVWKNSTVESLSFNVDG